ncbi:MAG: hypothetical protein WDO73_12575 [Ignavibacteriota bacterium]
MSFRSLVSLSCLSALALHAASTPASALLVLEKEQNTLTIVDPSTLAIVARVPAGNDRTKWRYLTTGRRPIFRITATATPSLWSTWWRRRRWRRSSWERCANRTGSDFAGGKLYFTAEGAKVAGRYDPAMHEDRLGDRHGTESDSHGDGDQGFEDGVHFQRELFDRQHHCAGSRARRSSSGTRSGVADAWTCSRRTSGRSSDEAADGLERDECGGRPRVEGFDLTPDGKELWVANAQDRTISIVDVASRRVVATIPSTHAANRLKITLDGKYAFVSDLQGNELLVVDVATRKEYKKIALPGSSEGLLMAPGGKVAYTTLNTRDAVAAIDLETMKMTGEVKTGRGPDGLAWAERK